MLPDKRISLECPVLMPDQLQRWVEGSAGAAGGRLTPAYDYHLTVLHLGRTREIYGAIAERISLRQSGDNERRFLSAYRAWLEVHVKTLRHPMTVFTGDLSTLGSGPPPYPLVCKVVNMPPALEGLHADLLAAFGSFLEESMGIPDGPGFLSSSSVFGYSGKSWVPHITVGTIPQPKVLRLQMHSVQLAPMRIRNGESLGIFYEPSL